MKYGTNMVVTCAAMVLWDGVTNPEVDAQNPGKAPKHSLKLSIPANSPEAAEMHQLATDALNSSEYRGAMPAGGSWPMSPATPADIAKFGPRITGHVIFNPKTWNGQPEVVDMNGQTIPPAMLRSHLFPGAMVKVIVHAYAFNNKQKGIGFGLDGVQSVDVTTEKLPVAAGLSPGEMRAAFLGTGAPGAAAYAPPGAMPPPPAVAPPAAPGAPMAPAAPPAGPRMTAAATTTYEAYRAANWTDEQLRQHGLME